MPDTQIAHFKHRIGTGLHYVTEQQRTFRDGTTQLGDTSETCVLYTLHTLLFRYWVPDTAELWNQVYPGDFMSNEDLAFIIHSGMMYTEKDFDLNSPDDILDILEDVRKIGCPELADLARQKLEEAGVVLP